MNNKLTTKAMSAKFLGEVLKTPRGLITCEVRPDNPTGKPFALSFYPHRINEKIAEYAAKKYKIIVPPIYQHLVNP